MAGELKSITADDIERYRWISDIYVFGPRQAIVTLYRLLATAEDMLNDAPKREVIDSLNILYELIEEHLANGKRG